MDLKQRVSLMYVRTKFKLLSTISKRKAAKQALKLFLTPQKRNIKALPADFMNAEKLQFSLDGNVVNGYRWNFPSAKKLLILHGFESSVIQFDHLIKPLTEAGYEVLAFDAPAHGRSSGKMIDVFIYKNMIDRINRLYGPVTNFIAHSFGGLALTLYLEDHPHDQQFKVVLIAPATETKTAIKNYFTLLNLNEKVKDEFEKQMIATGGKHPSWYSISRASENIKAGVLFLQDEEDALTPLSDVKPIMNKNYPNFHFVISKGFGHRWIYKDPSSVSAIINFLK
jgi:esterase/lipase